MQFFAQLGGLLAILGSAPSAFVPIVVERGRVHCPSCAAMAAVNPSRVDSVIFDGQKIVAVSVDHHGAIIVDAGAPSIATYNLKFRPTWTVNRQGIGPGELTFPFQARRTAKGDIGVLDIGAKSIVYWRPDGSFLRRTNFGLSFSYVSDLMVTTTGVIVAGVTSDPRGADYALHFFDSEMRWLRSAAKFSQSTSRETLQRTGVGLLERINEARVLFIARSSDVALEYTADGTKLIASWSLPPIAGLKLSPVRIARGNDGSTRLSQNPLAATSGRPVLLSEAEALIPIADGGETSIYKIRRGVSAVRLWTFAKGSALPTFVDQKNCLIYFKGGTSTRTAIYWAPLSRSSLVSNTIPQGRTPCTIE